MNDKLNINNTPQNYRFTYDSKQPTIDITLHSEDLEEKSQDYFVETNGFSDLSGSIHSTYPLKEVSYQIKSRSRTAYRKCKDKPFIQICFHR